MIRQTWLSCRTPAHKNPPPPSPLGGWGGAGNEEGCFWGAECGWCFMGFTMLGGLGGGVNKQRLGSGFIGGGLSGLILCCFYSKQRDQNKEGGMHSGCWVCIGSGDSMQLQLLRVENNI